MSQAEELELLELEEEEANANAARSGAANKPNITRAAEPEDTSLSGLYGARAQQEADLGKGAANWFQGTGSNGFARAALSGLGQGLTFGFGDELGAAEQAALTKLTGNGDFGETYRKARDENRTENAGFAKAHPGAYYPGELAGGAVTSTFAAPFKAVQGAGLLSRGIAGAGNLALGGTLAGAGASDAQDPGDIVDDAAKGGAGALALGGAGSLLAKPLGYVAKNTVGKLGSALLNGIDKRAPAIDRLRALGVDTSKLSTGQLAPGGTIQLLEEAAELGSPSIKQLREGGKSAWQDAVLRRGAAPGVTPSGGDISSKLESAFQSFGPAYDSVASAPVTTAGPGQQSLGDQLRAAFKGATADRGVLASDAERASIGDWLDNQASVPNYSPGKPNEVGDLLKVRSNIRTQQRGLPGADARRGLLGNAEDAVTSEVGRNLTPEQAQSLQDIDNQYRQHLLVSGAASRANGAPAGFTPAQLETEVKAAVGKHAFARGGGDELRQLADAGRQVFDVKVPPNGARKLIGITPGWVQKPAAELANTQAIRSLLLGESAPQQKTRALINALRNSPNLSRLVDGVGREATLLPPLRESP